MTRPLRNFSENPSVLEEVGVPKSYPQCKRGQNWTMNSISVLVVAIVLFQMLVDTIALHL